jgi:error-prone DNA polymerase
MPEPPDPKARPHPWAEFYREPMLRSMHLQAMHLRKQLNACGGQRGGGDDGDGDGDGDADAARLPRKASSSSASSPAYAELHVTSNFTFLTGASHPEELIERAAELGHRAIAITDVNSLAGIVRGHIAAKERGVRFIVGCHLQLSSDEETPGMPRRDEGAPLRSILVYPTTRAAYGRLCRLLTLGKRRTEKGQCQLSLHDLIEHNDGLLAIVLPPAPPQPIGQEFIEVLEGLRRIFRARISLGASCLYGEGDRERLAQLAALAEGTRVPLVATNDVHYHDPRRRMLQDVLTCVRHGCTIEQAGLRLFPNAERCLKPPQEMARLFAAYPEALARSVEIASQAAAFSLDELRYEYPDETCPPGLTPMQHLIDLTWRGAAGRYPQGVPGKVRRQIEHEFDLIDQLNYAPYFLTVHDLVQFARSRGILCQGRGAAANSAVCYCLGVTAVDPDRIDLLFERFMSKERHEPPDIDIDFEHERREEVIQYMYQKYGRERAALTAEVITYRGRSAVRDVGKALGLSLDCVDRLAKSMDWWDNGVVHGGRVRELGLEPDDPMLRHLSLLMRDILGFPRHLSQHVGGFVITRGPLCESVPIENAAMPDRTVIEWDKDDIDALGMLKVDVLGLGMLTCIGKCFRFVNGRGEPPLLERHGGTEARRHEGNHRSETFIGGISHGRDSNISRPDRVATSHGTGTCHASEIEAPGGEEGVHACPSDVACSGVNSVEHCRGLWPPEHKGLFQVPAHCSRIARGTIDAVATGDRSGNHCTGRSGHRTAERDRSCAAGPDSESGSQTSGAKEAIVRAFVPSCLRASVPHSLELHTVPPEDPAVYDMICNADTIGVFQIESRAQMSMLPRLKPRCYYDLVIEVAIVRPGPIQGNMVHPYLRRRNREEAVTYPSEAVRHVLGKTLGVPLFQEQAMALAMVAAGFTAGEADQLRRAMAAWKRKGDAIYRFGERLINGMLARGYEREFAERCFEQIKGFSEYGFPESHAASFALLVYVSSWLKKYHPAEFAAALINSQPMGFYAPAQIVRDAQDHGVEVRPIDVNFSRWDCTIEYERHEGTEARRHGGRARPCAATGVNRALTGEASYEPVDEQSATQPSCLRASVPSSLRLGMRLVKGLREAEAQKISAAVESHGAFASIESLWRASGVQVRTLRALARADAFRSLGLDRQAALWHIRALRDESMPIFDQARTKNHRGDAEGAEKSTMDVPALRSLRLCGESRGEQRHDRGGSEDQLFAPVKLPGVSELRKVAQDYGAAGLSLRAHPISFIREVLGRRRVTRNIELKDESRWPTGRSIAVAGVVLVRQRPATASGIVFMTIEDETGIANLIIRPRIYQRFRSAARHGVVVLARGTVERQGQVVHVVIRRIDDIHPMLADRLDSRSRDFH